jgi:hypothetical protein
MMGGCTATSCPALTANQNSKEIEMADPTNTVVVTDIKIPFWSLVVLMVKWALAAIPAVIILIAIATVASALLGLLFGGAFQWPWGTGRIL